MQSSNAPNKISLPFASSGTKNTIPVPSQQGVTPGAASFTDGFPPLTFTPLSAGGVPPSGADFNGVLNAITALQQWKSAGGQFPFDATFATAIGGYPKGATVLKADGTGLWISTAENNTANPDTGGAGWVTLTSTANVPSMTYSQITALTANQGPIICSDHGGAIFTWNGTVYAQTTPNSDGGAWASFAIMPYSNGAPIVAHNIGSDSWWLKFATGLALAGFMRSWAVGTWTLDSSGYYTTSITTALPLTFTSPPQAIALRTGDQISGFVSPLGTALATTTQVTLPFQAIKETTTNISAQGLFSGTWK